MVNEDVNWSELARNYANKKLTTPDDAEQATTLNNNTEQSPIISTGNSQEVSSTSVLLHHYPQGNHYSPYPMLQPPLVPNQYQFFPQVIRMNLVQPGMMLGDLQMPIFNHGMHPMQLRHVQAFNAHHQINGFGYQSVGLTQGVNSAVEVISPIHKPEPPPLIELTENDEMEILSRGSSRLSNSSDVEEVGGAKTVVEQVPKIEPVFVLPQEALPVVKQLKVPAFLRGAVHSIQGSRHSIPETSEILEPDYDIEFEGQKLEQITLTSRKLTDTLIHTLLKSLIIKQCKSAFSRVIFGLSKSATSRDKSIKSTKENGSDGSCGRRRRERSRSMEQNWVRRQYQKGDRISSPRDRDSRRSRRSRSREYYRSRSRESGRRNYGRSDSRRDYERRSHGKHCDFNSRKRDHKPPSPVRSKRNRYHSWSTSSSEYDRVVMARINGFAILVVLLALISSIEAKKKNSHAKGTVADDAIHHATPIVDKKSGKGRKAVQSEKIQDPGPSSPRHHVQKNDDNEDYTIEDVDEDKIEDFLKEGTKNLVVFFYDGRLKCEDCGNSLQKVEEIDDDIENTGYVEVVKTDDRRVAREFGVTTFPSLIYFRRRNPILYDGDFTDSEVVLRWIRAHDEVATWDLTDYNFEARTNSFLPDEGALDWFVMFYDGDDVDDRAFIPVFETVAHKLRGLVHCGKIDTTINDDVTERFRVDEHNTPTFLLLHRGKMYRYNDPAKDVKTLVLFSLSRYADQRGHRIPEAPSLVENLWETGKEWILEAADDSQKLTVVGVGSLIIVCTISLFYKAHKIKAAQVVGNSENMEDKNK
uniref:Thioredoxin domain-containing protein n=1 Tax=Rhabditophanes sp. KR3021 TaxID=114890 RepID=A0AC35TFT7_9BILA